jgi:hypothetical protein
MHKVVLGKSGLSLLFPSIKKEGLKTFKKLSQKDIEYFGDTVDATIKQEKLSSRRVCLYKLTNELYKSDDPSSYFLASQINMVLSTPELVRKKLMGSEGNLSNDILEKENESLKKLKRYYSQKDLPAIFSTNAKLYYTYLESLEAPDESFDRRAFVKDMESVGNSLSMDKYELKEMVDFYRRYCNKPMKGLPMETYLTNYLYRLFCEFAYEKDSLRLTSFKEFCKFNGKCFSSLAKTLEDRDYMKTFNVLYDYSEYVNKLHRS